MSPAQQAERLVTDLDGAEAESARVGRALADVGVDLDSVGRWIGTWHGAAGAEARSRLGDTYASVVALSGHCLYVADLLRVEGAYLARALVAGGGATEVEDADRLLAERLAEAADALAGYTDPATTPCLDLAGTTDDDPRAVADLWHSLDPAERARLARDHPELGHVAGLPSAQRDALNRERLARFLDAGAGSDARTAPAAHAAYETHAALAAHLAEDPRRHLLAVHADGRAVVASADPDGAARVVTLVPGTGSSSREIGRTAGRAEAVCEAGADAGTADGEVAGPDPAAGPATESCVSVAWQGYHAPPTIPDAAVSTDRATAHADDLRTFAAGLDAVDVLNGDDAPHAVVGYSYGSTVLGAAASDPRGLAADDMVHVGSPGAYVESRAEQWVDEGGTARQATDQDVSAVASRWDPVPWWSLTGVLGALPGSEEFGGLAVDVSEPGSGPRDLTDAHSDYFDRGTVSLAEIGRLVLGREAGR